jgi:hypothetical protein
LLAVNPYVAKHAKLPPPPNVEQKMYDDFAIDLLKEAAVAEVIGTEEEVFPREPPAAEGPEMPENTPPPVEEETPQPEAEEEAFNEDEDEGDK